MSTDSLDMFRKGKAKLHVDRTSLSLSSSVLEYLVSCPKNWIIFMMLDIFGIETQRWFSFMLCKIFVCLLLVYSHFGLIWDCEMTNSD